MRGRRRPNQSRSARCVRRIVVRTASGVTWRGTLASGRWRVTSTTRNGPPTNIMAMRGDRVARARNSVWPMKGMPARWMAALVTGAVTKACTRPCRHWRNAASR